MLVVIQQLVNKWSTKILVELEKIGNLDGRFGKYGNLEGQFEKNGWSI